MKPTDEAKRMNQPKPNILMMLNARNEVTVRVESESQIVSTIIAIAETEKTAYKLAANKLRRLAYEADRLADASE